MLVIVTMRRLDRALQQLWKNVKDAILGVQEIVHPSEKEIVNAISIASIDDVEAPQEGALYMIEPTSSDGVDGFLFLYQNGVFDEVTPEKGIIYIVNSPDKSRIYIYNAPLWEDVTGQPVDNTLYITNTTTDLESYTDKGMYSVCLSIPLRNTEWYTFTVSFNRGRHMLGRPSTNTYIQTLINNDGWKRRTKVGDGSWSEWEEHCYVYPENLTSKQDKSDSSLQTTAKTVVSAINEVNTKANNIEQTIGNEDMSAEHAQSIKGAIAEINYWKGNASQDIEHAIGDIKELQSAVNSKQDKSDASLQTTAKAVVEAINEVNTKANNIEQTIGNEDMSAEHAQSIKGAIAEINYWKGNASQDIEHAIGDIKELQSAVNSKQPLGDYAQAQHTHVFADITDVSILPDNDAQIIIPIDDDILTSIVNQTYSPEDTAMFSGHSEYPPLSDQEVTRLVDLTIETYRQAINLNN
ncbi:MAG: hypothetical protein E7075_00810 [Bacteroidales bacterium]|nr:hypothetical protein [Bacteroidales bacterium]